MKYALKCTWQIFPEGKTQTKIFNTLAEANKFVRSLMCQIDISKYTEHIRKRKKMKNYVVMADFLDKYLSDPDFPKNGEPIPDVYIEDDDEEETLIDTDFYTLLYMNDFELYFDYKIGECPHLETNMLMLNPKTPKEQYEYLPDFEFQFYYDNLNKKVKRKVRALSITLSPKLIYGTSSYPFLILNILKQNCPEHIMQNQIIKEIKETYDVDIERKAITRNIALLNEFGYVIKHDAAGYYMPNELSFSEKFIVKGSIRGRTDLDEAKKEELIKKLERIL